MIRENQEALDRLVQKIENARQPKSEPNPTPQKGTTYDDNRLIDKMCASQNGGKILDLLKGDWSGYASQSEADQALCNHLAFWTDKNETQIDRIFRGSGLYREEKWDKKHYGDGRTYGQATIEKAIQGTIETYRGRPERHADSDQTSSYNQQPSTNKKRPRAMTLSDLRGQFESKTEFLWRQHIAARLPFIVNGREGDGKTSICLKIGKEIKDSHADGYIVWLPTEGSVADTVVKMEELKLDDPRFIVAQKSDGSYKFDFYLKGDRDELDMLLSDLPKPILAVFIDSIRGMSRYDDNDAGNGDLMHKLNAIVCDKYRAALIYIDHWGKGNKTSLLDRNVGSTAKTSAVRGVLSVLPVSKFKRVIKKAKGNISQMGGDLEAIKIGDDIIIREPNVQSDETLKDKAEEFVIGLFSHRGEIPSVEVYRMGAAEGFSESLLKVVKKELSIESTRDNRDSPWKWTWPIWNRDSNDSNNSKGCNI